jgi:tetratricopeptide (TPR) repeat protein
MISENKENLTEQDLSLAIFHNIIWNNLDKALDYAKIWNEKYPDTEIFFGYIGWLQLEKATTDQAFAQAKESLKKWLEINRKSAMIHFSLWRLDVKNEKYKEALLYFKKTISLDKHGDFTDLAREQIKLIEDGNFLK